MKPAHVIKQQLAEMPAFPVASPYIPNPTWAAGGPMFTDTTAYGAEPRPGMTYEQWLVGMALQGICASPGTDANGTSIASNAILLADLTISAMALKLYNEQTQTLAVPKS